MKLLLQRQFSRGNTRDIFCIVGPREVLLGSFLAALAAADPLKVVPPHLPTTAKSLALVSHQW